MNFASDNQSDNPALLLENAEETLSLRIQLLKEFGFDDLPTAAQRLAAICEDDEQRKVLRPCLPTLLYSLSESANPDQSLLNFERYIQRYNNYEPKATSVVLADLPVVEGAQDYTRLALFHFLADNPRAVEILMRLFVGSQFLTEILLRNPNYLEVLTRHKRLGDFKSREEFTDEAIRHATQAKDFDGRISLLRHYQHWELLRIGACDSFGLMDFKGITLQLSLLADALAQACLHFAAEKEGIDPAGFTVLAFGKLGGEELNYSSDIDLVFLVKQDASRYWGLGQSLIDAMSKSTAEGFMYRVDMRLRPWGQSGALVCSVDSHIAYLKKHGMLWEKQALLKARPIAGDLQLGKEFLKQCEPIIFDVDTEEVRENVLKMKLQIERTLKKQGRSWGEVKGGKGSIRDVEFATQYLQLSQGMHHPQIRSINTSDALIRLAENNFIQADEYRQLSSGYVFLRIIEHALQLTHYKAIHHIPKEPRELSYLARKLDFPDSETFVSYYENHSKKIRKVFEKYLEQPFDQLQAGAIKEKPLMELIAEAQPNYAMTFSEEEIQRHAELLESLEKDENIKVATQKLNEKRWQITVVGKDAVGQFSVTCGLLFTYGYNILRGHVFTGLFPTRRLESDTISSKIRYGKRKSSGRFVTVLEVTAPLDVVPDEVWKRYAEDLLNLSSLLHTRSHREVQGILAKRVGKALRRSEPDTSLLLPVEITLDNQTDTNATILDITGEDLPGFLYELTTGLAISGLQIDRVIVDSAQDKIADRLYVTDSNGKKITDESKLNMLRTAIVLIKHFVHMLPGAPNPESALLHFRELVEKLFDQPDWSDKLASLEQPKVLDALAKMLGVSDFLWEDFLRLQYTNLFPVVTDIDALSEAKDAQFLQQELATELQQATSREEKIDRINAFKDREMLRTDMRHILGMEETFGQFSLELTDIAEVVLKAATSMLLLELTDQFGEPTLENGEPCQLCVAALGKCGGKEIGFASDIELMFLYSGKGRTSGSDSISNNDFFTRLVEGTQSIIRTKRDGIFELDLRLRPFGQSGSPAVSLDAFEKYFSPEGAAWPYERQALVKFRPIAGNEKFGQRVVTLRDKIVYTGEPFDTSAMRGMRERQERQLVKPGTINAKLSNGCLVDCEYLVQGMQITYGAKHPELRTTNTREALRQLEALGILSHEDRIAIRDAYRFLRRLIDALRMVRGDARELTVPKAESEECEFLARRLSYQAGSQAFIKDLEQVMQTVQEKSKLLEELPTKI